LDGASFADGLLNGLREGVEAAVIVGIILAYLAKTGNARHFNKVWIGTGAAVAASLGVGALLWSTIGDFEGPGEDLFEGISMLAGATVVTWMIFWMRRTAAAIAGNGQPRVDSALVDGSIFGLAILAFMEVIREGIDIALFLLGQAAIVARDIGAFGALGGSLVGIGIAIAAGYAVYRGAAAIETRRFFRWSGVALVFIAAGLLSHAIQEFVRAGWSTVGTATAFDISALLPHMVGDENGLAGVIGSMLRAIFGYSSHPEWITFLTWIGYLAAVLTLFLRPLGPAGAAAGASTTRSRYESRPPSEDLAKAT